MFIGPWNGDLGVELPDILVVQHSQLEEVKFYFQCGELATPSRVFYVVPGVTDHLTSVCFAIKYLYAPSASVIHTEPKFELFFDLWERIVRCDGVEREQLVSIERNVPGELLDFHPQVVEVLQIAKDIISSCRDNIVFQTTVFGTYSGSVPFPYWRRIPLSGLNEFDKICRRIETKARESELFESVLKSLLAARTVFSRLSRSDIEEALVILAAYSLALAEELASRGDTIGSISLSHRCLDFFLQSICVEYGFLAETGEGLRFQTNGSQIVGMMACYKELTSAGRVLRKKSTNDQLHRCNNIRNYLISTHSVFGASTSHAAKYKDRIVQLMMKFSPDRERAVSKMSKTLQLRRILPKGLLFSDVGDVTTNFVEVQGIESASAQAVH